MAARTRRATQSGGVAGWFVTFADLVTVLMAFFVMIVAFSNQDEEKLQQAAGSIKDAFGIQPVLRPTGIIEIDGLPVRNHPASLTLQTPTTDVEFATIRNDVAAIQGPEANTHDIEVANAERIPEYLAAAASLRQAWASLPDIAELSQQVLMEISDEGLHIILHDQDGRAMFPDGSSWPFYATEVLLRAMGPVIAAMPNRVEIIGHTTPGVPGATGSGVFELSAARAGAARQILQSAGVRADQIYAVVGRGAAEPLIVGDAFATANRRVEIILRAEAPPLPPGFRP